MQDRQLTAIRVVSTVIAVVAILTALGTHAERRVARFRAGSERRALAREADAVSVARQRAEGPVAISPSGEPRYAIVRDGRVVRDVARMEGMRTRTRVVERASPTHRARVVWGITFALLVAFVVRTWIRGERYAPPTSEGPAR